MSGQEDLADGGESSLRVWRLWAAIRFGLAVDVMRPAVPRMQIGLRGWPVRWNPHSRRPVIGRGRLCTYVSRATVWNQRQIVNWAQYRPTG